MQYSNKPIPKTFTSLKSHNIKKRYNVWEENTIDKSVQSSHLVNCYSLEEAIEIAQAYQKHSDIINPKGKFIYHVDIEILVVDSSNDSIMEDGDIAYALTVYPTIKEFDKLQIL